jgi:hypothetical protein
MPASELSRPSLRPRTSSRRVGRRRRRPRSTVERPKPPTRTPDPEDSESEPSRPPRPTMTLFVLHLPSALSCILCALAHATPYLASVLQETREKAKGKFAAFKDKFSANDDTREQTQAQKDKAKNFMNETLEESFPEERKQQFIYRLKKVIVDCQQHGDYDEGAFSVPT